MKNDLREFRRMKKKKKRGNQLLNGVPVTMATGPPGHRASNQCTGRGLFIINSVRTSLASPECGIVDPFHLNNERGFMHIDRGGTCGLRPH